MNKILLSTVLIASLGVATLPVVARAADGTINITGLVTAGTCKVGTGSPYSQSVVLPTVQSSALTGVGTVAGSTAFSFAISGCATTGGPTKATTYFEPGANIDTTTHNLFNTGGATGVEVQLLNGAGSAATAFSPIVLGNPIATQNSGTVTISAAGGATMNYYAQYYASAATPTAGTVTSAATFTMIYQ